MRYLVCVFLLISFYSCKEKNNIQTEKTVKVENLDWLLGNWERVGEKEGNKTYEYWKLNGEEEYVGIGCTLKGLDTIWKEDVLISQNDQGWNFDVMGLGDTVSTIFKITEITKNSFTCENDLNEFPKKIKYVFDGKNINAVISGGGPTVPFNFVKMKN